MMQVRGMIVNDDSLLFEKSKLEEANEQIEQANERIKDLEGIVNLRDMEIQRLSLDAINDKKEIKELRVMVTDLAKEVAEIREDNRKTQEQMCLMSKDINAERTTSYYQMLTSAISVIATVATMVIGIRVSLPMLRNAIANVRVPT